MATLKDTIQANRNKVTKTNQGLFETASDAAANAGLTASPITPKGVAQIGANPDQAKMAGTPAAKTTALRETTGAPTLREAVRQGAAQSQATEAEKQRQAQTTQMSMIAPALEDRVQAIATRKLAETQGAAPVVKAPKVDPAKMADSFPGVDANAVNTALEKVTTAPATDKRQAAIDLANQLGIPPPTESTDIGTWVQSVETKLAPALGSQASEIAKAAADAVADYKSITMGEIFTDPAFANLGSDIDTMAQALGLSRDDMFKMDLDSFESALAEAGVENMSQVNDLVVKANDPFTPPAEREALRQELRRLGAAGVRATEQDYQAFQKDVESSKLVNVGGREMTMAEALSDERISREVMDYLSASDEARKAYQAANPELAAFAESNRAVLSKAAETLKSELKSLGESVVSQLRSGSLPNGVTVSQTSLKKLFPDLGKYGSVMPQAVTDFLGKLGKIDARAAQAIDAELASGTLDITSANRVLDMGPKALEVYAANPQGFKDWLAYSDDFNNRLAANPTFTTNSLMSMIEPDVGRNTRNQTLASSTDSLYESLFDSNRDNKVDSFEEVAANMRNWLAANPGQNLEAILKKRGEEIAATKQAAADKQKETDTAKAIKIREDYNTQANKLIQDLDSLLARSVNEGNVNARKTMGKEFNDLYRKLDTLYKSAAKDLDPASKKTYEDAITRFKDTISKGKAARWDEGAGISWFDLEEPKKKKEEPKKPTPVKKEAEKPKPVTSAGGKGGNRTGSAKIPGTRSI